MKRKRFKLRDPSLRVQLKWANERAKEYRQETVRLETERDEIRKELEALCGVPPWASNLFNSINRIVECVDNLAGFINNSHAEKALKEYDAKMARRRRNVRALASTTRKARQ